MTGRIATVQDAHRVIADLVEAGDVGDVGRWFFALGLDEADTVKTLFAAVALLKAASETVTGDASGLIAALRGTAA